ncbi:MAG: hypothetical protein ACI9OJ_001047 [Myxococcota bacterium]|jgi:hypothetical protein
MIIGALLALVLLLPAADVLRRRSQRGTPVEWGVLGVLVLAAVIARAFQLGASSLEHLEATYLFESVKPATLWGTITSRQAAEQMHQPLYDILLRYWADASTAENWIRIPSVVFSVACVPLMWTLVRDEVDRNSALWAAAMTAVAPILVWYGRDATPYALLAMTSLTAIASARQALERPSRWAHIRTAIALSLAFYTHFHGGWVAITVGAWMVSAGRERRRTVAEVTGFTAILCLPWIPALLNKLFTSVAGLSEDQPLMRYSHAMGEATTEAFRLLLGTHWWAVLPLVVVGSVMLFRSQRRLFWLVVSTASVGLVAELHILWQLQTSKGIVYVDVRHYIYLAPILLIPVAALRFGRGVCAALVTASLIASSIPMVSLAKPDARNAIAYLKKFAAGPEHAIAYLPAPWYESILEYYLFDICPDLVHARSREGWWDLETCEFSETPKEGTVYGFSPSPERAHLSTRRRGLKYLWVLDMRDHRFGLAVPPTDPQERFLCWKDADQALIQKKTFGEWIELSVYDAAKLRLAEPPPEFKPHPAQTVTSDEAWQLKCAP